jgi:hypothetical protein
MVIFYEYGIEYDKDGNPKLGPTAPSTVKEVIKILGYVQFCTAITLLMGEMYTRAHLIVRSGWRKYVEQNRITYANLIKSEKDSGDGYSVIRGADMTANEARLLLLT